MISPEAMEKLQGLKGLVATVVLGRQVRQEFALSRENMRAFNIQNGLTNIEYVNFDAVLVEHGRDNALAHALQQGYDWCLQIDADATFPEHALAQILHTAYVTHEDADVVGAYSQLKSPPYLPTIDTGTGTWEPIFPGEGVLPVMRTGGHFLLIKTPIARRFGPPWFRTRLGVRPIEALREVDNFARIHNDGTNPLGGDAWDALLRLAQEQGGGAESPVGEDSAFCDTVKSRGGKIYVDTNLVTGHVGTQVITPEMLRDEMKARKRKVRAALGVTS